MYQIIKQMPYQRWPWLLLAASALCLELSALFFQYGLKLDPCVMCIYERTATFGVMFAGLIGAIAPRIGAFRWAGFAAWATSCYYGLTLSIEHTDLQMNPSPFKQCSAFVEFPQWLKLDAWFPLVFEPSGDCSSIDWMFFGWSMPQWLIVCFAIYTIILAVIIIPVIIGLFPQKAVTNNG